MRYEPVREENVDAASAEVGPGDSLEVTPVIDNTTTEEMYVFIEIDVPEANGEPLYTLDANDDWILVEENADSYVYAYGDEQMTVLNPGEQTEQLTSKITMKEISNAEYAYIDDIGISIKGYGIDTKGEVTDPASVWNECKTLR